MGLDRSVMVADVVSSLELLELGAVCGLEVPINKAAPRLFNRGEHSYLQATFRNDLQACPNLPDQINLLTVWQPNEDSLISRLW